mmetsp:Transcript_35327/g.80712  ORF Transcript_35327/g.80712 Transcript_35327/m.80712 type:complete len:246 (-) Transcript_35327:1544-2281(-)
MAAHFKRERPVPELESEWFSNPSEKLKVDVDQAVVALARQAASVASHFRHPLTILISDIATLRVLLRLAVTERCLVFLRPGSEESQVGDVEHHPPPRLHHVLLINQSDGRCVRPHEQKRDVEVEGPFSANGDVSNADVGHLAVDEQHRHNLSIKFETGQGVVDNIAANRRANGTEVHVVVNVLVTPLGCQHIFLQHRRAVHRSRSALWAGRLRLLLLYLRSLLVILLNLVNDSRGASNSLAGECF